jgi:hypothetical protein
MRRPIYVGEAELNDAHLRVGRIITFCSQLEEAISYLQWQLFAFAWDVQNPSASASDRQIALRQERARWDKYADLTNRLSAVSNALTAPEVSSKLKPNDLRKARREWQDLRERARRLGDDRNRFSHTFLSYSDGKVIRQVGRPWKEQWTGSQVEDEALIKSLVDLTRAIGGFTEGLAQLLPFADQDQMHWS